MARHALGMTREEEADRHWAAVSNLTRLADDRRAARRARARRSARVHLGLALVRAGLAIAPLGLDDLLTREDQPA